MKVIKYKILNTPKVFKYYLNTESSVWKNRCRYFHVGKAWLFARDRLLLKVSVRFWIARQDSVVSNYSAEVAVLDTRRPADVVRTQHTIRIPADAELRRDMGLWNRHQLTELPAVQRTSREVNTDCENSVQKGGGESEWSAMLNYWATPLADSDKSPAELLFNRRLRTKLPVPTSKLVPTFVTENRPQLVERQQKYKNVHVIYRLSSLETSSACSIKAGVSFRAKLSPNTRRRDPTSSK